MLELDKQQGNNFMAVNIKRDYWFYTTGIDKHTQLHQALDKNIF